MKSIILLGDLTQISNGITPFDRGCGVTPEIPSFGRHCQPRGRWRTQEDPEMMMMICLKWNNFTNPPSYPPPKPAYFKNSQQIRGSGGKEAKKKKKLSILNSSSYIYTICLICMEILARGASSNPPPSCHQRGFWSGFSSFLGVCPLMPWNAVEKY